VKRLLVVLFLAGTVLADDAVEQKQRGDSYRQQRDFAMAEQWYRRAVAQDNLDAVVALADLLMRDATTRKAHQNEATQWYLYALSRGREDVYFQLGQCYDNGWGVKRDLIDAYKWYLLVANEKPAARQRLAQLDKSLAPGRIEEARRRAAAFTAPSPAPK